MGNEMTAELERLKKDFFEAEQICRDEKECFLKVINTFGTVMAMHGEFAKEYHAVKKMINTDETLPVDLIEKEISNLKGKIFAMETEKGFDESSMEQLNELNERLLETCRIVKRVIYALLDDFYPLTNELKAQADAIRIDCHAEVAQIELEGASTDYLSFINGLKDKIGKDFKYINNTFIMFLEQVKQLETDLTGEFDGDARQKDFEQFEMKVNSQVGSIVDSFNIHDSIDELKSAVVEKLKKIKGLLSKRKNEEVKRLLKAKKNISRLKKRIVEAELGAKEMTKKAKHFQKAAVKDGLTGLYNRKAFNVRLHDAQKALNANGEPFSVVLFDVDKFKWINDNFGHVAGDKVLKQVAQCLLETFRKNDFIARFGGDEFAVVVEGLSEEMARKRIVKFQENFQKKRFVSRSTGNIDVTISAGIAQSVAGEVVEDIINRADKDMYTFKKNKKMPSN
jgi:diguanylate cyclase (GGDEF)-like protein